MRTPKLSPRARSVLARMNREEWMFVPQQTSERLYITQAGLVRAGYADWLPSNKVTITDAGRAALESP